MGTVSLCGSICNSCEANSNIEQKNMQQLNIDQLLIKEIHARENVGKMINKEIEILKENLSMKIANIQDNYEHNSMMILQNINDFKVKTMTYMTQNNTKIDFLCIASP